MIAVSMPGTARYHAQQYQKDVHLGKLKTLENLIVTTLMQDDSNSVSQTDGKWGLLLTHIQYTSP
jgi:hypothetical protein